MTGPRSPEQMILEELRTLVLIRRATSFHVFLIGDKELVALYREFSSVRYSAGWMLSDSTPGIIEEFIEWITYDREANPGSL
jgi:hypothetical protein